MSAGVNSCRLVLAVSQLSPYSEPGAATSMGRSAYALTRVKAAHRTPRPSPMVADTPTANIGERFSTRSA